MASSRPTFRWQCSRSFECREVNHQLIQIGIGEVHGRHQRSRFEFAWRLDPVAQAWRRIAERARTKGVAAHQVRQIRPKSSVAGSAADRMAVDAGGALEY